MKILALEFSSDQRSVAIVSKSHREAAWDTEPPEGETLAALAVAAETGSRSVQALGLVESALREAQLTREQIEVIAVGLGPGSFMGIRIAIALAQGWQLARGVQLLGMSSLDTLAAEAHAQGLRGRVHAAIEAQREEVYLAAYEITDSGWQETAPVRLAPVAAVQSLAATGEMIIGPEVKRWCESGRVVFPSAKHLGLRAASRSDFVAGEKLEPVYLRAVSFVKTAPRRAL